MQILESKTVTLPPIFRVRQLFCCISTLCATGDMAEWSVENWDVLLAAMTRVRDIFPSSRPEAREAFRLFVFCVVNRVVVYHSENGSYEYGDEESLL